MCMFVSRFNTKQIQRIKELKVFDMIVSVTKMTEKDLQSNPFRLPGESMFPDPKISLSLP